MFKVNTVCAAGNIPALAIPNKKRSPASTQGELVKAIGTNNTAPTTKPIRNTRNGPTSSILCPIRDAAISVPRPGVAATTPATKATSPP